MEISRAPHPTIAHLREDFLRENQIQFVLDKAHRYGWADCYAFSDGEAVIGYGSVWGKTKREDRDAIFEFYLAEQYRVLEDQFFNALCVASNATYIECQSNDKLLYKIFQKFAHAIQVDSILFADGHQTNLRMDNARVVAAEPLNSDDCQYKLFRDSEEVGEGGFMLNYNFPYADVYYGIHENYRGRGYGSFLVQELKKEIRKIGRVPAARCNPSNTISKATLLKAGMIECGLRLTGTINRNFLVK